MGMPRYAKQRDANEQPIVEHLRARGYVVVLLDEPCDLLIQCRCGRWSCLEVKNPETNTRIRAQGRTKKQLATLSQLHAPIPLVTDAEEAARTLERACGCVLYGH